MKGPGMAAFALLAALFLARLLTLGVLPLFDTTEGRYAEIGREMAASGDWITPTLHGGEPFWGKPPLHFWLTATAIRLFGSNEWAARLPSFLAAAATLALVGWAGRRAFGAEASNFAVVLLGSSGLFYLLAGSVVLDVTFTFTTTGALGAFLLHMKDPARRGPGFLFFLFLGLGLLAKGPVAAALVFLPIGSAALLQRSGAAIRSLPWFAGTGAALLIAAPWYLLAERATPGFSDYFFVHEHWFRYLRKEYGDLYGHGHVSPYGLVWALACASFLPWTPALLGAARRALRGPARDGEAVFLWLSALAPLVFFTFSRSLSLPYVLPSLPFFALILGRELAGEGGMPPRGSLLFSSALLAAGALYTAFAFPGSVPRSAVLAGAASLLFVLSILAAREGRPGPRLAIGSLIFPVFILAGTIAVPASVEQGKSARHIARVVARLPGGAERGVLFYGGVPLSAEFYFAGRVRSLGEDPASLVAASKTGDNILVIRSDHAAALPPEALAALRDAETSGPYRICLLEPPSGSPDRPGGEDSAWK